MPARGGLASRLIFLTALALASPAPAALADDPPQTIRTVTRTVPANEELTLRVDCIHQHYDAVAAAVVAHDPLVVVFSMRRVNARTWEFSAKNFNPGNGGGVTVEIRCVRVRSRLVLLREDELFIDQPDQRVDEVSRCPRGYAPIGTGFSHFPTGGRPGDPPPDNAFIHTFDSAFVRGGFDTLIQKSGPGDVTVREGFLCIDRVTRTARRIVRETVRRVLVEVDAPPQELREVRARCPRDHVSTGLGFDTPDDSTVRVEPTGWTGVRGFSFNVLNAQNTEQPVQLQALCLSEN